MFSLDMTRRKEKAPSEDRTQQFCSLPVIQIFFLASHCVIQFNNMNYSWPSTRLSLFDTDILDNCCYSYHKSIILIFCLISVQVGYTKCFQGLHEMLEFDVDEIMWRHKEYNVDTIREVGRWVGKYYHLNEPIAGYQNGNHPGSKLE